MKFTDWINLVHYNRQWQNIVKMLMNLSVVVRLNITGTNLRFVASHIGLNSLELVMKLETNKSHLGRGTYVRQ